MKKLLLHTFAILLSALMVVETVGIYLTKDICNPCGKSEITAQLIIAEMDLEHAEHACCDVTTHEQDCCGNEINCSHNESQHNHHQEHHFFKNISVFLSTNNAPQFEAQALSLLAPLVALLAPLEADKSTFTSEYHYTEKIPQDNTLALLCTYLI